MAIDWLIQLPSACQMRPMAPGSDPFPPKSPWQHFHLEGHFSSNHYLALPLPGRAHFIQSLSCPSWLKPGRAHFIQSLFLSVVGCVINPFTRKGTFHPITILPFLYQEGHILSNLYLALPCLRVIPNWPSYACQLRGYGMKGALFWWFGP